MKATWASKMLGKLVSKKQADISEGKGKKRKTNETPK